MNRRSFILGLLTTTAAPILAKLPAKAASANNLWVVSWGEETVHGMYPAYGRSPMMDALPAIRQIAQVYKDVIIPEREWFKLTPANNIISFGPEGFTETSPCPKSASLQPMDSQPVPIAMPSSTKN